MAGVTDFAFRTICRDAGAGLTYTEMISSRALVYQDKKTNNLLYTDGNENPFAVQIFGNDPDVMAEAARIAAELTKASLLDINMGCPTPKITTNGDGCALMRDIRLAEKIILAVVKAINIPVTVKFRKGWDSGSVNAVPFAKAAEAAGASALCIHGRTKTAMYSGRADRDIITRVVDAVNIPVIANGDIIDAEDCKKMLTRTGAAAAMVGRAAFGNPWIFTQANSILAEKEPQPLPGLSVRLETAERQIRLAAEHKGEHTAILEARRHMSWYLKGIRHAGYYKERVSRLSSLIELQALITEVKSALPRDMERSSYS